MNQATTIPVELLHRVVDYFNPRRVILFGSHATGRAEPGSDFDLLVILDDDAPSERLTLRAGWESRQGFTGPADVIPVRDGVDRRKCKIAGTLAFEAELEGITLYERA